MLRWITAGESHGPALVAVLEGMPAGVSVTTDDLTTHLARRRLGYGRGARMNFETDQVEFLGGVRHGLTMGGPIAVRIGNTEWPKWETGHGGRPGRPGRAGGLGPQRAADPAPARPRRPAPACRSTASTSPAGAGARQRPGDRGPGRAGHGRPALPAPGARRRGGQPRRAHRRGRARAGRAAAQARTTWTRSTPTRCAAFDAAAPARDGRRGRRRQARTATRSAASSRCSPTACRRAWASHVHWDRRLDARLAGALMGIQAIKGVEIGDGFTHRPPPRQSRPTTRSTAART